MEKSYYSVEVLEEELREYEERYGLASEDFYEAHRRGSAPSDVSPFDRVVWADLFRVTRRLELAGAMAPAQPVALQAAG